GGAGDGVVIYDKLADRWVMSQFASLTGGKAVTEECFAVSTTSDASGSYYRYAFHLGGNFIDSPHLSVQPDGYLMGDSVYNEAGTERLGNQFFMFDRTAMLNGAAATVSSPGIDTGVGETYSISADGLRVKSAAELKLAASEAAVSTLTINLTYDPDSTFTNAGLSAQDITDMKAANAYAAAQFTNNFHDPINVNIRVTAVPGKNTLGGSSSNPTSTTYSTLRAKMLSDATTADDTTATGSGGSIPPSDPVGGTHSYLVTPAQAKALGISAGGGATPSDGTYTFGGGNMYTYDPNNRTVAGKYDYIGVSMHEFSEIMGRIPAMGPDYMQFDLFHYTGTATRGLNNGPGRFFSIDNGTTLLKAFNDAVQHPGDLQDWAISTTDCFNYSTGPGVKNDLTSVDLRVMDAIGYDFGVSGCSYSLSPASQGFGSSGGSGSFGVSTSTGCAWAAVSDASWITTTSSGSGNGTVNFAVAANTGVARTGTITVGGQTFTVTQSAGGGGCPSTPISVGQTINGTLTTSDCIFTGTTRYVDVYNFSGTAGQQIAIAMNSSIFDTYLYLLDGSNQLIAQDDNGGGGTNSRIPASSGAFTLPSTGTLTIYATSFSANGTTGSTGAYTISLSSGTCSYGISPSSQSFGSSGGSGSFGVTTSSGCAWTAISNASWVTTSSSGSGNGTVNFTVAANTGASRTGTISVGGQTFTISESSGGGCPSTTISAGQTINGTLTTSDCIFSGTTRYVDVYNFSGTAGQQVVVAMNSSVFDTYLYLLDGSNQLIAQDDDGGGGTNSRIPATSGAFTLPATGTFTIYATSFSADGTTGSTGAYAISLSSGTQTRTLTVGSSNPSSGVSITVSPNDNNSQGNGTTQFTRTYNNNTNVSLMAPSTAGGNNFQKWQLDGVDLTTSTLANFVMDANHTVTAVYTTPVVTRTLTVASSNPTSGVSITISPNDNNSQGNGTTQFSRTYNNNVTISLTALATASGNIFQKWQRDGTDWSTGQSTNVTMDANHTMTAFYTAPNIQITVQTNPSGRTFTVDGTTFSSTQTFSWTPGSSHTISTISPQAGSAGTQFVWNTWSDSGAISHSVAPTTATTYTANFTTQFMLTMSAGAGGTVSPASAFFNSGQSVNISATPNGGFTFTNWTGTGTGSFSGATNPASVTMNGPITETASFAASPKTIQLSASTYAINEGGGFVTIGVTRSGDTSGPASVAFAASNGTAKEGRNYVASIGTLSFAAGEISKSFPILIIDNAFVDGSRTVNLTLTNPTGGTLGAQATATLTIAENDVVLGANPVDTPHPFVQFHYYDFLGRYPDQSGWDFWTNNIAGCTPQPSCTEVQRINTSAAYFLSIEFQQTGYLVYKTYKASFGNITDIPNAPVPIKRQEFLPDTQEIGNGVIVNQGNWQQQLEANKQAFTLEFVQRSRFTTAFPTTMTPAQFVDKLFSNAGVTPSAADRNAAIAEFGSATTTSDVAARSRALRDVAENATLNTQEFNKAFVLMQYFGYLRRNPYDPPEGTLDYSGFNFWLGKLNSFGGNFINAEMVKAFISSTEYRQRFGP
ncbi:MAG TPA: hypothetical protein DC054_11740, partial [Blastocatellia bacterium]|nr:hypothetical protein [Blastocatellia bacterium]